MTIQTLCDLPSIDMDQLVSRCMGNRVLAERLVGVLVQTSRRELSSLELAWTERNWEETRRLAHRIKGSAANSSALRSMQVATELEAAAKKAQDYELVDILMVRLREAIVELQRYVAGDPSHAAP